MWDCGMAEKVRPVIVMSVPFDDTDRALTTIVMHTTSLRGSKWEVPVKAHFLKEGAFLAQSLATYPAKRAIRRLGALTPAQLDEIESAVFLWLGRRV
jgi:mRNA interferase MazF